MKKIILIFCCLISLLNGMEITIKKESGIKKDGINVILDIYNVLLHQRCSCITDVHKFFLNKSFVVKDSVGDNYIVPAYLPEFIKYVMSRFNIAFFSDRAEKRNRSVIEDIWIKAFGTSKPNSIRVLSDNNLTYANDRVDLQPPKIGGVPWWGNNKKDIRKVGQLYNTILVEDNQTWVMKGQESNFLSVSAEGFLNFKRFVQEHQDDDKDTYNRAIKELLGNHDAMALLSFYKLLYIAGVLDIAAEHKMSIIDGLRAIQFENDVPKFSERQRDLQYYKRGYRVLLKFSDGIAAQQETILHLLQAHPEVYWSVLPPEIRQLIVGYMMQLTMCIFPEIEKHFGW